VEQGVSGSAAARQRERDAQAREDQVLMPPPQPHDGLGTSRGAHAQQHFKQRGEVQQQHQQQQQQLQQQKQRQQRQGGRGCSRRGQGRRALLSNSSSSSSSSSSRQPCSAAGWQRRRRGRMATRLALPVPLPPATGAGAAQLAGVSSAISGLMNQFAPHPLTALHYPRSSSNVSVSADTQSEMEGGTSTQAGVPSWPCFQRRLSRTLWGAGGCRRCCGRASSCPPPASHRCAASTCPRQVRRTAATLKSSARCRSVGRSNAVCSQVELHDLGLELHDLGRSWLTT